MVCGAMHTVEVPTRPDPSERVIAWLLNKSGKEQMIRINLVALPLAGCKAWEKLTAAGSAFRGAAAVHDDPAISRKRLGFWVPGLPARQEKLRSMSTLTRIPPVIPCSRV